MVTETIISKFLSSRAIAKGIPLSGTFELSPCCNLNCKMCYVRRNRQEVLDFGGEIGVDEWIKIAEECKKAGMLFLLITGGEPFLYKDFKKLYLELSKMGFMISINTNGTLIDEKTVEFLKKNPPGRINITIYGGSESTYERLCGDGTGFNRAVKAVELLKNAGLSVKMNATMTEDNINDLDKIYDIAKRNNVFVETTTYSFPPIRRDERSIGLGDRFSPEKAAFYELEVKKRQLTSEQFNKMISDCYVGKDTDKYNCDECGKEKSNENLGCRGGKCAFWINWKGEMTSCGMMNSPSVNVIKHGFIESWSKIKNVTKNMYMPVKCTNCNLRFMCEVCGAVVVTETGGLDEAPSYMCRMTAEKFRLYNEEYQKLVKEGKVQNEVKEGIH